MTHVGEHDDIDVTYGGLGQPMTVTDAYPNPVLEARWSASCPSDA